MIPAYGKLSHTRPELYNKVNCPCHLCAQDDTLVTCVHKIEQVTSRVVHVLVDVV